MLEFQLKLLLDNHNLYQELVTMKTRIELLMEMGVSHQDALQYIDDLEMELPKYGIAESRLRLAHFFAQVMHLSLIHI